MDQATYDRLTPAEKVAALEVLSATAQQQYGTYSHCVICNKVPFYATDNCARMEGHVYSALGIKEFRISRYCEWCFDLIMKEPEEKEDL